MVIFYLNQAYSEGTNCRTKASFTNGVSFYYPVRLGRLLVESLTVLLTGERIDLNQSSGVYKMLDMGVDILIQQS